MAASLKKTNKQTNKTKARLAPLNKKCASQLFFNPFTPSSVQSKNSRKEISFLQILQNK